MLPAKATATTTGEATISTIFVDAGQCLTVWFYGIQIELYVTEKGEKKIFCDESLEIFPFSEYPISIGRTL